LFVKSYLSPDSPSKYDKDGKIRVSIFSEQVVNWRNPRWRH